MNSTDRLQPPARMTAEDELTEEERIEYEKGILTWSKAKDWRFWIRKEWTWYYLIFLLIVLVVALMTFFHHSVGRGSSKWICWMDR